MAGRLRHWSLVGLALLLGAVAANAQSPGSDEAITSQGGVIETIGLTPAQKNAIYNEILRQRTRVSTTRIEATAGALVPRSVALAELPAQIGITDATSLKYAMVADDVVVVDSINMRVVDVIRGNDGR
jgi:hypothetical protein